MMAHFPGDGLDDTQATSVDELPPQTAWSEEQECIPLKQRLKMLRSKAVCESREEIFISDVFPIDDLVKREEDLCGSPGFCSDQDGSDSWSESAFYEHSEHGTVLAIECPPFQDRLMSKRQEIEYPDAQGNCITQLPNCKGSSCADDIESSEDFCEDLDHVVLKERQRLLLSRYLVGSTGPTLGHKLSACTDLVERTVQKDVIGNSNHGITFPMGGSNTSEIHEEKGYTFCEGEALEPCSLEESRPCFSGRHDISEKPLPPHSCSSVWTLALPAPRKIKAKPLADELQIPKKDARNIKVEPLDDELQIPNKDVRNIKVEPLDDELQIPIKDALDSPCIGNQIGNSAGSLEDIIDHMMLGDRMRLLASHNFPKTILNESFDTSRKFVPSVKDHKRTISESSVPHVFKQPRKRRKTVTDSIETALEEDAPGLLQVLIEKGVLVDEIKLYGENEGDESLDESSIEESFSEFEEVLTQLFSERPSFLKLASIKCGKRERATYCLGCLISLVEQVRYLRIRKWPVEWGWCRDLQSFIFVFERHNRIVLERPEYGYATYFFELVDTLPVPWQIKRLVTAMKLTSCSRITLIENRALTVGDDLTEGEARVLMEYGWMPDSGLGTMLNYCDRVVHDRKNDESDSSEWRSKISKLLTAGYNGGTIVPSDIPKKVMEYVVDHNTQIKLEQ